MVAYTSCGGTIVSRKMSGSVSHWGLSKQPQPNVLPIGSSNVCHGVPDTEALLWLDIIIVLRDLDCATRHPALSGLLRQSTYTCKPFASCLFEAHHGDYPYCKKYSLPKP